MEGMLVDRSEAEGEGERSVGDAETFACPGLSEVGCRTRLARWQGWPFGYKTLTLLSSNRPLLLLCIVAGRHQPAGYLTSMPSLLWRLCAAASSRRANMQTGPSRNNALIIPLGCIPTQPLRLGPRRHTADHMVTSHARPTPLASCFFPAPAHLARQKSPGLGAVQLVEGEWRTDNQQHVEAPPCPWLSATWRWGTANQLPIKAVHGLRMGESAKPKMRG